MPHCYQGKHDLESILYTLIYVLAVFKGPRNLRVQQDYDLSRSSPSVFEWFDYKRIQQSLRYVARTVPSVSPRRRLPHSGLSVLDDQTVR